MARPIYSLTASAECFATVDPTQWQEQSEPPLTALLKEMFLPKTATAEVYTSAAALNFLLQLS
jgi:hypothetical protein